jgi:hypothetical protein
MIELVGKWAHVPYWQCLSLDQAHPEFQRQLRLWFLDMDDGERVEFFARGLRANGYYRGDEPGRVIPQSLREAVMSFQIDEHLAATGDLSYETYERLARNYVRSDGQGKFTRIGWGDDSSWRLPGELADTPRGGATQLSSLAPRPPRIKISLPSAGNERMLGESIQFNVSVDRTSYLQCYYRDAGGTIAKVYPNPTQPWPLVEGNRSLLVPDLFNPQTFSIELTRPGSEELRCLATVKDPVTQLPPWLQISALEPVAAQTLDAVSEAFGKAMGDSVGEGRLQWKVSPP